MNDYYNNKTNFCNNKSSVRSIKEMEKYYSCQMNGEVRNCH